MIRSGPAAARAGYTLIELMIVVAIIGVLAAIAVPAFMSQMHRSRTAEAFSVIGAIREAQDAYYATFSQYCGNPELPWNPVSYAPPSMHHAFDPSAGGWADLGVEPEGPVRFRYRIRAGVPGTTPPGGLGFSGAEHWYVIQAEADLDGDGTSMAIEAYSASPRVFISAGVDGPYLAAGWE